MPICMYPSIAAPERKAPNYAKNGQHNCRTPVQAGSAVVPGELVFSAGSNLITGHGTYRDIEEVDTQRIGDSLFGETKQSGNQPPNSVDTGSKTGAMRTSLTGRVRIVNKLVYVEPAKARYSGNVGDTVVGRIVEVEQRRWRVNINSALYGNLALANVKLPGGELRRKSEDDERAMRSFMKEGDLIVAEVHEIYKDGSIHLHMPGTRTGKLGGGCLLRIPPSLVKRQKIHRHRLAIPRTSQSAADAISIGLILGCNGYLWIGPSYAMDIGLGLSAPIESDAALSVEDQLAERYAVSRVRNCILALTNNGMPVWETSVLTACEASWVADRQTDEEDEEEDVFEQKMDVDGDAGFTTRNRISRLLRPDVSRTLVSLVQDKLGYTT